MLQLRFSQILLGPTQPIKDIQGHMIWVMGMLRRTDKNSAPISLKKCAVQIQHKQTTIKYNNTCWIAPTSLGQLDMIIPFFGHKLILMFVWGLVYVCVGFNQVVNISEEQQS